MIKELRNEPPLDKNIAVQVAGDPEKKIAKNRKKTGIPIENKTLKTLQDIAEEYGVSLLRKES